MKRLFYIIVLLCPLFFGCNKEHGHSSDELTGAWMLTEVYDKNTASNLSRPSGGNVIIIFQRDRTFLGRTIRNTFNDGSYTISGTNKVTFGSYTMTKVAEDEWGGSFHTVLTACSLQSVFPCAANEFSIQGNKLTIRTPLRYDITLSRQ
jgi:hypothetical protein